MMRRSLLILTMTTISLGSLVAAAWLSGFRINTTPSMPLGIYRVVDGPPQRGDIVALCPPAFWGGLGKSRGYTGDGLCPDGSRQLLKFLVGIEGDNICVGPEGITVNGTPQPYSARQTQDRHGRSIASLLESGVIPPEQVLVLAPVSWSFDGRYFGFVPAASLLKIQPILTFNSQEQHYDN